MSSNNNNQLINYSTFGSNHPHSAHYVAAFPPDPLQRFGSGHLDQDIFGISVSRLDIDKQMIFMRKVFGITIAQTLIMATMVFFIIRIYPIFQWLKDSTYSWWIPIVPALLVSIIIIWQLYMQYFQLSRTSQISLLSVFSVIMSFVVSEMISKLCYDVGFLVIVMTLASMVCLLLSTFQKKFAFSGAFPFVCSLGAICLTSPWLRFFYELDPIAILYPIGLSTLISTFILLELYHTMETVTADDYILANVNFFIDAVYPIRFIHHVCELTDNMNFFPDILSPRTTTH